MTSGLGGSQVIPRDETTPELRRSYEEGLGQSLRAGHAILPRGGTSLDADEAAIVVLEDLPLFNAGKGAAFTRGRRNLLDASIMDGRSRQAGAVASVSVVRNPIKVARAVTDRTSHVLMAGPGADRFARDVGLEVVPPPTSKPTSASGSWRTRSGRVRPGSAATSRAASSSGPPGPWPGTGTATSPRRPRPAA